MNNIIIITNLFPYGNDTGEMYLRTEIYDIAKSFDQVFIFAMDATIKDSLFADNLPLNIHSFPLGIHNSSCLFHNKFVDGVLKCKKEYINNDFAQEIKKCNMIQRLYLRYFINRCYDKQKRIEEEINDLPIKNEDKNIVYSYRLYDLAYLAIYVNEYLGKDKSVCVSRAHRYDLYEEENVLGYLPMREYILEHTDAVLPCSMNGTRYLKEKYPKYKEKIMCSYLGSDDFGVERVNELEILKLVSCSTMLPVKRVDRIAGIVKQLSGIIPVQWIHIGGEGKALQKLNKTYHELVVNDVISFLGNKKHGEIVELYQTSQFDIFVNLSLSEGVPQAIMEALSFGIPVLATNVGGNCEIVEESKNGFLFSVDFEDEEVINKILEIYNYSKEEKVKLHNNARESWENKFKSSCNSRRFIEQMISMRNEKL